jgi:RNA polymerase sigma-70 factor (ECF subfamily)
MHEHLPPRRLEWPSGPAHAEERAILEQFIAAHERCDADAAVALVAADIRITMPPNPYLFEGRDSVAPLLRNAEEMGDWRLVPTFANRMPTAASYVRRPGDTEHRAFKLDVLRIDGGRIVEITTFGPKQFPAFGLLPVFEMGSSSVLEQP